MKLHLTFFLTALLLSSQASALILLCNSPDNDSSGKALTAFRFNTKMRTMEKWIYLREKGAYMLFDYHKDVNFSDQYHQMTPPRRAVSAEKDKVELLYAYQIAGSPTFVAKIRSEGPGFSFQCRWKE